MGGHTDGTRGGGGRTDGEGGGVRDDEPVFKRSKWGANRYYYNPRNPVGLTLIIVSLLLAATVMILMTNRLGPFAPTGSTPAPQPSYESSWPPYSAPYAPSTGP
ncbi:hypothetical protein ACFWBI_26485 [Streptomyces sp. NPDC059982]|uniref:hypothetical protein n=1 Tax=Streptomyces sp. NPDC059982 TaxID=3347024 RepID=UPI0036916D91